MHSRHNRAELVELLSSFEEYLMDTCMRLLMQGADMFKYRSYLWVFGILNGLFITLPRVDQRRMQSLQRFVTHSYPHRSRG